MPAEEWQALVSDAAQAIRSGHLEKLVLARSVRISGGRFDPYTILSRLRVAHPGCVIFAIAHHDRIFLGATPEQLVRLNDGAVEVPALAGTRRRGVGEQEDVWLGNELLTSPKERSEHEVVVRAITERLSDVCDRLNIPKQPVLLKLRQVQHLHTPISGRLSGAAGVLDLIERLHPTPAVGGVPQEAALTFLRQREHLDRGWYAAPIGWVNHDGDGEFAVAIRSALLSERQADGSFGRAALYAGCGIMGDSDPASEFAESCSKLAAMFSVLDA
jgi:isochorismate synthase